MTRGDAFISRRGVCKTCVSICSFGGCVLHPLTAAAGHVWVGLTCLSACAGSTQEEVSLLVQEEMRKADVTGVNRPVAWDGATKARPLLCRVFGTLWGRLLMLAVRAQRHALCSAGCHGSQIDAFALLVPADWLFIVCRWRYWQIFGHQPGLGTMLKLCTVLSDGHALETPCHGLAGWGRAAEPDPGN